jgi:hypothetical protein
MRHNAQQTRPEAASQPPTSACGTNLPPMPMTASPENSLEYEISQKPAIESRLLSDMESLENK